MKKRQSTTEADLSIILADDDPDDRFIFQEVVKQLSQKINLQIVGNGQALMSLLSNYLPDLLFIDLDMPIKNGLECIKEIKEEPSLKELPIIVFSSTGRQGNINTAYEIGAHLVVKKLANFSGIREAIRSIITKDWTKPEEVRKQQFMDGNFVAYN